MLRDRPPGGAFLRTGESAEASTATTEAPDAGKQLHGIMRDLIKGLLGG
jgi:hypothetical protein